MLEHDQRYRAALVKPRHKTAEQPSVKDLPFDLRVFARISFYLHSFGWLGTVWYFLGWVGRKCIKPLYIYPKVRMFLYTVISSRVSDIEYEERMQICSSCIHLQKGKYCGSCKCPKWFLSRLSFKNRFKKHGCPHRFHPHTTYPKWHDIYYRIAKRGCSSCKEKNNGTSGVHRTSASSSSS